MAAKHTNWDELPIQSSLPEILDAIEANVPVILAAPPGAGKTTAVPLAMLDANVAGQRIVMVEPRRMAARASAQRIAHLQGSDLGDTVGYQVRFDSQASTATKLICMTPGILLRRLIDDPELTDVSCVVLDEFHERSLEYDLLLGILTQLRQSLRPDLRLVIMSATLDIESLQGFLPAARAIISHGRSFPVDIRYAGLNSQEQMEPQIATQIDVTLKQTPGHILVFLPGRGEIAKLHRHLETLPALRSVEIKELFGEQTPETQDEVLRASAMRKVILSTNVAETSVTIENVTAVIDSGLARVAHFDAAVGLPRLQLEPISLASADQRAGRAGRTAPGICVRMWNQVMDRQRRSHLPPEILRTDLCDAMLFLCGWGGCQLEEFPWLTAPRDTSVAAAVKLLIALQAIDSQLQVTPIGRKMQRFALHPRLSRLMLAAVEQGCVVEAALVASLLSDRSPFTIGSHRFSSFHSKVEFLLQAFEASETRSQFIHDDEVHGGRMRELLRSTKQILKSAHHAANFEIRKSHSDHWHSQLTKALLQAFPDRVSKLRAPGATTGVLVGGRGVQFKSHVPESCLWALCLEVEGSGKEASVREFLPVEMEWLCQTSIQRCEELEWSESSQSVVARERSCYFDLVVSETPKSCRPSAEVAKLLQSQAMNRQELWYPDGEHPASYFIERVRLLSGLMPELELEPIEGESIELLLDELCQTRTSIEQLKQAPWLDSLQAMFNYSTLQAIDRHAPTHLTLPSTNQAKVHYPGGRKPYIEARIQELFGWKETPRIAGGRLRLQIHLLGPNYRPQQITEDLSNFWNATYFEVRKELKRRYPKHHWPEDPLSAPATRNGLQPK